MSDIAARRALRKRIMAAAAVRRPRKVARPQPPNGIVLAHTAFLLSVTKDMDRAIFAMLKAEGVLKRDAKADPDVARLEADMERQLRAIASRKNLVGMIDEIGLRTKRFSRTEWQGDLIVSLAKDKVRRVRKVLREAGANARVEDIAKAIRRETGATRSRAALIARTEVTTLNSRMTQARHQAAGIHEFTVSTSQDERVRESHRALEGMRFEYGKPPIVDGEPFIPGSTYNCRCIALPIIPGIEE